VKKISLILIGCMTALLFQGCQHSEPPAGRTAGAARPQALVTAERLLKAELEPSQWMTYNGTYSEQHYSRLTGITRDNVGQLGLAWFADYDTNLTQSARHFWVLAERGMASFADSLKPEDTQALRAYLVKRANDLKGAPAAAPRVQPQDQSGNQHQTPGN
jgi:hypothetical protein